MNALMTALTVAIRTLKDHFMNTTTARKCPQCGVKLPAHKFGCSYRPGGQLQFSMITRRKS